MGHVAHNGDRDNRCAIPMAKKWGQRVLPDPPRAFVALVRWIEWVIIVWQSRLIAMTRGRDPPARYAHAVRRDHLRRMVS